MPPLLAGRDAAQNDIKKLLVKLTLPSGIPSDVLLYGPRGTGKTVLLQWLEEYCMKEHKCRVLPIVPSDTMTLKDQLMEALDTPQAQVTTEKSSSLGISLFKALVKRTVVQSSQARSLDSFLIDLANKKPLVLLVDEAHTMSAKWGRELLNVSQNVRKNAPFLLVLAGTPGLRDCLRPMKATFWIRTDKIPMGRLTKSAANDAISTPLHNAGISLDSNVLSQVVTESQCYPYFIQLLGSFLWDAAKEAESHMIDQALLDQAWDKFNRKKGLFYQDCFNDISEDNLEKEALAVAKAFASQEKITTGELREIVAGRPIYLDPPEEVKTTISKLKNLGYIWQGSEESDWEPGIPSLMAYVRTEEQKLRPSNSGDLSLGM
ncbi:MAG: AAA family ATPase [Gammaproteobacteria bacterium]|nr:AAA family ATPase [Gammaproteobacteria bacterium]